MSPLGLKKRRWWHHAYIIFFQIRCTLAYLSSPKCAWPWQISLCSLGQLLSLWCFQTCFVIETILACCIDQSWLQTNEDLWIWTWNSNAVRCSPYYWVSKGNYHPCLACHTKIIPHGFFPCHELIRFETNLTIGINFDVFVFVRACRCFLDTNVMVWKVDVYLEEIIWMYGLSFAPLVEIIVMIKFWEYELLNCSW